MPVNPQKLGALIEALHRATEEGRVEWEAVTPDASADESTYVVSLTHGTVAIWSRDRDGMAPFILQIRGDRGQVVDEIPSHRDAHSDGITSLYQLASGSARNANAVIDSLLDDLDRPF